MALFGKKKKIKEAKAPEIEETLTSKDEIAVDEEDEKEVAEAAPEAEKEQTPEEKFKRASVAFAKALRVVFPQQLLIGFYYGELQSGGYIDDFCCYATDGRLLERQQIPSLCGLSLPDMVAREEKIEQAFFDFRKAAEEATNKPCNAVSITMMNNGQMRLDITAEDLVSGEENERYDKWRKRVEMANPRYMPPRISQEALKQIQEKTADVYRELGSEFYSFLPDTEYKIGYFYTEIGNGEVSYHHRLVTNDGEFIDDDELFDRYDMNKEEAAANRVEIVKYIMQIRQAFIDTKQKPFTAMTLSVTDKGEFQSHMSFGPTDAAGEAQRLENWKNTYR